MPVKKKKLPELKTFAPLGRVDVSGGLPSERVFEEAARPVLPQPEQQFFPPQQDIQPKRTLGGTLGDIGTTALTGLGQIPKAAVGLADIPTGGRIGRAVEQVLPAGFGEEYWRSKLSPAQQYAQRQVGETKGFLPTIKKSLQYPSTIAQTVGESLPLMMAGGAVGRGAAALAPRIGQITGLAAGLGEGAVSAGLVAEEIRERSDNRLLTPAQSAAALAAGVGTGIFSAVGSRVANKFGAVDIDSLLAGATLKKPKDVAKAVVLGGISEGVFEELPQEMQEQVWVNAATGEDLLKDVPEAAAQAVLAGGVMGAGANVLGVTRGEDGQLPPPLPDQPSLRDQPPLPDQPPGQGVTVEPEGLSKELTAELGRAFDQARYAAEQGTIQPGTPEYMAVQQNLSQSLQSEVPEIQETLRQNVDVLEYFGVQEPAAAGRIETAVESVAPVGPLVEPAAPVSVLTDKQIVKKEEIPELTPSEKVDRPEEIWKAPRDEYVTSKAVSKDYKGDIPAKKIAGDQHENAVVEAIKRGETLPESVTKDYAEIVSGLREDGEIVSEEQPIVKIARKAIERGSLESQKEWIDLPEETETLSVPRSEMPQVKSEDRGALSNFLRARGVEYKRTESLPSDLKPTQQEVSPEKIQKAREYVGPERAILVSEDNHVIDGHHQWMSKLADSPTEPIPVIKLGGNVERILNLVKEFPSSSKESTPAGIEQAFGEIGEGINKASMQNVAQNIREGKTDRLLLTRPESIEAAQKNEKYNITDNNDGTATIIGVNTEGEWVGQKPEKELGTAVLKEGIGVEGEQGVAKRNVTISSDGAHSDTAEYVSEWLSPLQKRIKKPFNIRFLTMDELKGSTNLPASLSRKLVNNPNILKRKTVKGFAWGVRGQHIIVAEAITGIPKGEAVKKLSTIAHEVGHVIQRELFETADEDLKNNIIKAHKEFVIRTSKKVKMGIGIIRERKPIAAIHDIGDKKTFIDPKRKNAAGQTAEEYSLSFNEWFADQVAKALTTEDSPINAVERFFHDVAEMLRVLVASIRGTNFMPDQSIIDFLYGKTVQKKELGTRVLKEGIGIEGERTTLKDYTPKEFQEEFRSPKEMHRLTDSLEYKKILPKNTEKVITEAAKIKKKLNDAIASVAENKKHLVKLFEKVGTNDIRVEFEGRSYLVKKPAKGKDATILNSKGQDLLYELKEQFRKKDLLKFDTQIGERSIAIQPSIPGQSQAAQYGPKTLKKAAIEHVKFLADQYAQEINESIIKNKMMSEIVDKLANKGVGHTWRNTAADTSFTVKRKAARKEFVSEKAAEEYKAAEAELTAKPELTKKKKGELKTAGVSPKAATGLRGKGTRERTIEFKSAAVEEIERRVKLSKAVGALPTEEQANVQAEIEKAFKGKAQGFEIVTPKEIYEAVTKADAELLLAPDDRVEGAVLPDGRVLLAQGNIRSGEAVAKLTHELGVHARILGFKDEQSLKQILKRIETLIATGNDKEVNAAYNKAVDAGAIGVDIAEETLARLSEESVKHNIVQRLFSALKRFLAKTFPRLFINTLTSADMQIMARQAVIASTAPIEPRGKVKLSAERPPTIIADGLLNAAFQAFALNTKNLNATIEGETSSSSPEIGRESIRKILEVLRFVEEKTESEVDKQKQLDKKTISSQEALKSEKPIADKKVDLENYSKQKGIPPEVRTKVLEWLKKIDLETTEKTKEQKFDQALVDLDNTLKRYYKNKVKNSIGNIDDNLKKKSRKTPERKKSRYELENEADLKFIIDAAKRNNTTKQANNLKKRITRLEKKLKSGTTTESQKKAEKKVNRLKKRLYGVYAENEALKKRIAYSEQIKLLKEILKKAETEEERLSAQKQIDDSSVRLDMLEAYSNLSTKSTRELADLAARLSLVEKTGRELARINKEKWRRYTKKQTSWLAKEITGKENPTPETGAEVVRRKVTEKGLVKKVTGAYSAVENSILSWEFILDKITAKSGKKALQSRAVEQLGSMAQAAQRNKEQYDRNTIESMLDGGKRIFNVSDNKKLVSTLKRQLKGEKDIRVKGDTYTITPSQAAYWYTVRKDPKSTLYFDKMGFTPESWQDIDSLMTPEIKAWADYLNDDFLKKIHIKENKVYQAVNGVSKLRTGLDWEQDNMTDIAPRNLLDEVMNRAMDSNHYQAWAIPSKQFNDIFTDREIRGYIEQYHGSNTLKTVDSFLEDFAKSPSELRGDIPALDKLRSNVVLSMIGLNPTTFFKQLTSMPAYAADIPTTVFVKNFAYGLSHPNAVINMMKNSPMVQDRYGKGFERDVREISKTTAEQMVGGVKNVRDILMIATKVGDKLAISAGYTVYKYHFDKAITQGKSRTEAQKIANQKFEIATERTQQAGAIKDLGKIQRMGSLAKLFTMYMTSPAAYTRQTMTAIRHFKTDPVGSSKRLLIFNVMLPMFFQAVASGFIGATGDDDESDEFWQKEMRAVALGPFLGVPIARDLAAGIWDSAKGSWYGSDINYSPAAETGRSLSQAVFYVSRGVTNGDTDNWWKAGNEFMDFLGYLSGLPTKPARRLWEGWDDFLFGDTEHSLLATSGYSRATRKEKLD